MDSQNDEKVAKVGVHSAIAMSKEEQQDVKEIERPFASSHSLAVKKDISLPKTTEQPR